MKRSSRMAVALLLAGCAPAAQGADGYGGPERSVATVHAPVTGESATRTMVLATHRDTRGTRQVFATTPEQLWSALAPAYAQLQIPMGTSDPQARRFGNASLVVTRTLAGEPVSRSLRCGDNAFGQPLADSYRVTVSLLTTVERTPDGHAQTVTRLDAAAQNPAVSTAPVACTSTGRLEERLGEAILQRLAPG